MFSTLEPSTYSLHIYTNKFSIKRKNKYTYKCNIEAHSRKNFCWGNPGNITHSEGVFVALVAQQEMHIRRYCIVSVKSLAMSYFSTLSQTRHNFQKT